MAYINLNNVNLGDIESCDITLSAHNKTIETTLNKSYYGYYENEYGVAEYYMTLTQYSELNPSGTPTTAFDDSVTSSADERTILFEIPYNETILNNATFYINGIEGDYLEENGVYYYARCEQNEEGTKLVFLTETYDDNGQISTTYTVKVILPAVTYYASLYTDTTADEYLELVQDDSINVLLTYDGLSEAFVSAVNQIVNGRLLPETEPYTDDGKVPMVNESGEYELTYVPKTDTKSICVGITVNNVHTDMSGYQKEATITGITIDGERASLDKWRQYGVENTSYLTINGIEEGSLIRGACLIQSLEATTSAYLAVLSCHWNPTTHKQYVKIAYFRVDYEGNILEYSLATYNPT